ncbi:unnamed protein product (mitochondrion) [Plasmodiophora brassicae]|uniref:Homeobox domain-containing protein n=1 Tax=Plasmodiophora brassicae TaxID=37360 RepID=A0A0G4J2Q5_PLABS|nr:hypothetical protein PBRA_008739 [Plasmodiophora brassicae]SPQ98420.1 unnamed protein product [Plasmodiophora brassicae]
MSATAMTPEQQQQQQAAAIRAQKIRAYLEMNFARDPNPAPAAVQAIASQIGESRDAVHNWFIQRRMLQAQSARHAAEEFDRRSPFTLTSIQIGDWQCTAQFKGHVTGQFDFDTQTVFWIVLSGGVAQRIGMPFDTITAIELSATTKTQARIVFSFSRPPRFSEEVDPAPDRSTEWTTIDDFSSGMQASQHLTHVLLLNKIDVEHHLRALIAFSPAIKGMIRTAMHKPAQPPSDSTQAHIPVN